MEPAYARISAAEHELVTEAILEGDGVRAERMMRNHIRNSGVAMLDAVDASTRRSAASPRRRRSA